MAYQIDSGELIPNNNAEIKEEEEQPTPSEVYLPCEPVDLTATNPQTNIIQFPYKTIPIDPNIAIGAKVVRKIRPTEIGVVQSILLSQQNNITDLWVEFPNRHEMPYSVQELEQLVQVH